jgi:hypothetical protein
MGWAAVSPDGTLVVVANNGMLFLRDVQTGQGVGSPDGKLPLPGMATQPDWAPDGSALAVVLATMVTNKDFKGGAIARVGYRGNGAWDPPQTLVPSTGDNDNNLFPRWSPDGSVLAYVHAAGPAKDAPMAELRLVGASGGAPITLQRAGHQVGLVSLTNLVNVAPIWAPAAPGLAWLAFASARPYGIVRPMLGGSQIWIAAIDLAAAGDPSAAAFWLPSQDVTAQNVTPAWAPAVAPPTE